MYLNKIISLFIATALILAVGCQKELDLDGASPEIVRFGCDSVSTRAMGLENSGANALLDMGVYAAHTATDWNSNAPLDLMSNNAVVRQNANSAWGYAPELYWPGSGKCSFFAYAPYNAAGATITGVKGYPNINFTVNSDFSKQIDLLVAAPQIDQTKATSANGYVKFSMAHALTRITFAARVLEDPKAEKVVITQVKLKGLHNAGDCQMDSRSRAWALGTNPATAQYTVSTANAALDNTKILTTQYQGINTADGAMFLMPQTLAQGAQAEITYQIDGVDQDVVTLDLSLALAKWQAGESIRFLIALELSSTVDVDLSYQFTPWTAKVTDVSIETTPFLYVSDAVISAYDAAITRVYFYTNQPSDQVYIDNNAIFNSMQGTAAIVSDLFLDLDSRKANFVYDPITGKGHFDVVNKLVNSYGQMPAAGDRPPVLIRLRAGKLHYYITVKAHVSEYASKLTINYMYVGAFHRRNQKGERIITQIYASTVAWTAEVSTDVGDHEDLIIDNFASPAFKDNRLYSENPGDAEGANVEPNKKLTGSGVVYLRVGWKTTSPNKNRYARITITSSGQGARPAHYIFCRQGEEPDQVLMNAAGDKYEGEKFATYNLSNDGNFTNFPTQGGFATQWGRPTMWPLTGKPAPAGYPVDPISEALDTDVAICPEGYIYPTKEALRRYFYLTWNEHPNPVNLSSGRYADGYFDRRNSSTLRASESTVDIAGAGLLVHDFHASANAQVTKSARSVFFPAVGYRDQSGLLQNFYENGRGQLWSGYWSVDQGANTQNAWAVMVKGTGGHVHQEYDKRHSFLMRCIQAPNTSIITYDANGGQNAPRSSTTSVGVAVILYKKIPTNYWRAGYFFSHWNTAKDGTGTKAYPGTSFTPSTAKVTLYAQWSPYFTVDFSPILNTDAYAKYVTTSSYMALTDNSNGNDLGVESFSMQAGVLKASIAERNYTRIEFHKTIQGEDTWANAYAFCKNLNETADGKIGLKWRLPRVAELLSFSQFTPVTTWAEPELFGGTGTVLWSGTNQNGANAYQVMYYNSLAKAADKTTKAPFRCVREY